MNLFTQFICTSTMSLFLHIFATQTNAQAPVLIIDFCTVYAEPGDTVCVPLHCTGFVDMQTMQWSMPYDTAHLKFVDEIYNDSLPLFDDLGVQSGLPGLLIMSWHDPSGTANPPSLPNGSILMELCFEVLSGASGFYEIGAANTPAIIEIYNSASIEMTFEYTSGGIQIGEAPPLEEVTLGMPYEVPICQDSTGFLCVDIPAHFAAQGTQYHWYTENGTPVESDWTSGCLAVTASTAAAYTSYYCEITPPIPCNDTLYRSALITAIEQDEEACQLVNSVSDVGSVAPLQLYPNPTNGAFTLILPNAASEGMQVRVLNLHGQQVLQTPIRPGIWQNTLDASGLPAGVYWVSVHRDGVEVYGGKLVVAF